MTKLRTAVLGVGHWHTKFILPALAEHSTLAAVSEPDPRLRERAAGTLACPAYADFRALLDRERIDAAFVYGRHCDMAETAGALVSRGIPFAVEKPGGLTAAEVGGVARRASEAGLFAAVPFTHRLTPWVRAIGAEAGGRIHHAAFRLLSGPPTRYVENGVGWVLRPAESGGGCTINLSVLFVDLVRHLTGRELELAHAAMSQRAHHAGVEDYSTLTVRTVDGDCLATVETGYTYPTGDGSDVAASVRTGGGYYLVSGDTFVSAVGPRRDTTSMRTHHRDYYREFAARTLDAIATGAPPLAGLDDLYRAMVVVDDAYRIAGG